MFEPHDPCSWNAHQLSEAIHRRQLSCREVMQATLARVDRLNPSFNAIVSRASDDVLLAQADTCDAELVAGRSRGFMHGFPQAIKDIAHATGFPSTLGSPLLANAMPPEDSLIVQRMKAAGCIVIGKTNTPEFGLGSHTFNRVFGATGNAWDRTRSAGGSSGGAAVALALRLLPVADGSDFMGSLRNPAGWNHVFGLRPSQGRVPMWPKAETWVSQLSTEGPMARTVRDLAKLLDIQAGSDPRTPLAMASESGSFVPDRHASDKGLQGQRIGWLGDLNGYLAMEPGVTAVCQSALHTMAGAGAQVEPAVLTADLNATWSAWLVWRRALVAPTVAAAMATGAANGVADVRSKVKAEALWEHDQAQGLSFNTFMQAATQRSLFLQQMLALFERFDVLALPSAQVWPFAVGEVWPQQIVSRSGTHSMDTYHRWMEVTIYATFAGLPALCVPAGFDASGRWPMGLQLIGRRGGEAALLRAAAAYEAAAATLLARVPDGASGAGA